MQSRKTVNWLARAASLQRRLRNESLEVIGKDKGGRTLLRRVLGEGWEQKWQREEAISRWIREEMEEVEQREEKYIESRGEEDDEEEGECSTRKMRRREEAGREEGRNGR